MKMNNNGALVMPKNYSVMTEEEMCYTEGGARTPEQQRRAAALARKNWNFKDVASAVWKIIEVGTMFKS